MRPNEVIFFCSLYLLFFFMIGSLAGVTTFPPPPRFVGITISEIGLEFGITLAYGDFVLLVTLITTAVVATSVFKFEFFGTGFKFSQAFVVTVAIALAIGGLLAWTMTGMFTDVPIYVTALLTWPFIGLLMYNIAVTAKGGGE